MRKTAFAAIAAIGLAACAQSPESIAPVAMGGAYDGMSCNQAQSQLAQERATLAPLESAQRGAVTGDAIGVFLIGLPVSSISGGDREGEIAAAKGRVMALEARVASCR